MTRKEQAAARRDELLRIAQRHFARKGFDGTSLEDVAAEAGVTKGLLYHYFDSKQELFVEAIDSLGVEEILDAMPEVLRGSPVRSVVQAVATTALDVLRSRAQELVLLLTTAITDNVDARDRIAALLERFETRLVDTLEECPDLDPEADLAAAADVLSSAILFHVIRSDVSESAPDDRAFVAQLVRTFTRGITARH